MAERTYMTEEDIVLAFKQYLMEVQGLSANDAEIGATEFPDPYSQCYLQEDWVEDTEIEGQKVEVRRCWTDFGMMCTFDNSKPFRFYKYIFTPEGFGNTVGEYRAAKKLYRLNKSGRMKP